jgi:putative ABC transport system substrate-binding protein
VVHLLKVASFPISVEGPDQLQIAFEDFVSNQVQVVVVYNDAMLFAARYRIAELALRQKLPTIFSYRDYADAGGLMS